MYTFSLFSDGAHDLNMTTKTFNDKSDAQSEDFSNVSIIFFYELAQSIAAHRIIVSFSPYISTSQVSATCDFVNARNPHPVEKQKSIPTHSEVSCFGRRSLEKLGPGCSFSI